MASIDHGTGKRRWNENEESMYLELKTKRTIDRVD